MEINLLEVVWQLLAAVLLGIGGWAVKQVGDKSLQNSLDDLIADAVDAGIGRLRKKYGKSVNLEDHLPQVAEDILRRVWKEAPKWIKKLGLSPEAVEDKVQAWLERKASEWSS